MSRLQPEEAAAFSTVGSGDRQVRNSFVRAVVVSAEDENIQKCSSRRRGFMRPGINLISQLYTWM